MFGYATGVNEQIFSTTIDKIEGDGDVFFENLVLNLKPTVKPGQVRIITSPIIKIILATAQIGNEETNGFEIEGDTNLFESGEISANGKAVLSFTHVYQNNRVESLALEFVSFKIEQAPGFSEFVRRQLNGEELAKVT